MITEKTEDVIKYALQKNVHFVAGGKTIREGRLILYNIKDFYIVFNLITSKNVTKTYELPLPFNVTRESDQIIFDYTLQNIIKKDSYIEYLIKTVYNKFGKKSKLYDSKLFIKYVE